MSTSILANSRKANSFTRLSTSGSAKGRVLSKKADVKVMETQPKSPAHELPPIEQASYLSSAYDTIISSLQDQHASYASIHDLIESYHILNRRIRAIATSIKEIQGNPPALISMGADAGYLTRAIRRDIQLALLNPLASSKTSVSEYHLQRSQDLQTLCQTCLCTVSSIFVQPSLVRLFDDGDLQLILGDLLDVALAETLSIQSPSKIGSLALWVLRTQALPPRILIPHLKRLVKLVEAGLQRKEETQGVLDNLKIIQNLLRPEHNDALTVFSGFLPQILVCLCSEDAELRLYSAHALSGFALLKLKMPPNFPHDAVRHAIIDFIEQQSLKDVPQDEEPRLPKIVAEAFGSGERMRVTWCLIVVACFIVLLEDNIFTHPKSLRFCGIIFEGALVHPSKTIHKLHLHVWRSFVWAFSRLLEKGEEDLQRQHNLDKVLGFVAEELGEGVGMSLVAVLLEEKLKPSSAMSITRALKVIDSVIAGEKKAEPEDGLRTLYQMTSRVGAPAKPNISTTSIYMSQPATGLLDGTILEATKEQLGERVLGLERVDAAVVRALSEEEVKSSWDGLVKCWAAYAELGRARSEALPKEIFDIWQALLLVQGELQADCSLAPLPVITSRIVSVLSQLLNTQGDPNNQVQRLGLVRKLYTIAKNTYAPSWLPGSAQALLANVLDKPFDFTEPQVRKAWSTLCGDLVDAGIPALLHLISSQLPEKRGVHAKRLLWALTAEKWGRPGTTSSWEEIVVLLQAPFMSWKMSDAETKLWVETLAHATSMARASLQREIVVARKLVNSIGLDRFINCPAAVTALLSHFNISDATPLPEDISSLVDQTLYAHYPPQPEVLSACLNIIQSLGHLFSSASPTALAQCLSALNKSLHIWIVDEEGAMLDSEYTRFIKPFYNSVLASLRPSAPSLEALLAIAPFLVSVFSSRDPSGTLAFQEFWRATYHNIDRYRQYYPSDLTAILLGLADAYGGSLADGLSLGSESQVTGMITVMDSQSPQLGAVTNALDILPPSLGTALLGDTGRQESLDKSVSSEASTKRRHDDAFQPEEYVEVLEKVDSEVFSSPQSPEEDTQTRKRRRVSSWLASTSFIPSMLPAPSGAGISQVLNSGGFPTTPLPGSRVDPPLDSDDDDYDWEVGMSSQEIEQIRKDLISS